MMIEKDESTKPNPIIIKNNPKFVGLRVNAYGPFRKSAAQIPFRSQIRFTTSFSEVRCAHMIRTGPAMIRTAPSSSAGGDTNRKRQKTSIARPIKSDKKYTIYEWARTI
jgi:hypothetical protein